PLGNVDLPDAVKELNGKMFIKGNIDPVNTLLRGDRDKVTSDVSETMRVGANGMDGFILSSACSIAPPVPPDNIKCMVDICRAFKREA
ncbi:MAG: uroporphyrinogen decarboxylase, partial [Verrucomicrobiales bacterium]